MRGSYPEVSQPEAALRFEAELRLRTMPRLLASSMEPVPAAHQAHPRRVAVRVVKAAGAELGLFFTERGGHLEVTRYTGALADAIAEIEEYNAGSKVVAGDRLYEVNNVRGDPAALRGRWRRAAARKD